MITAFTYKHERIHCDSYNVTDEVSKSLSEDRKHGTLFSKQVRGYFGATHRRSNT